MHFPHASRSFCHRPGSKLTTIPLNQYSKRNGDQIQMISPRLQRLALGRQNSVRPQSERSVDPDQMDPDIVRMIFRNRELITAQNNLLRAGRIEAMSAAINLMEPGRNEDIAKFKSLTEKQNRELADSCALVLQLPFTGLLYILDQPISRLFRLRAVFRDSKATVLSSIAAGRASRSWTQMFAGTFADMVHECTATLVPSMSSTEYAKGRISAILSIVGDALQRADSRLPPRLKAINWTFRYPLFEHSVLQSMDLAPYYQLLPSLATARQTWSDILLFRRLDLFILVPLGLAEEAISSFLFTKVLNWRRPVGFGYFGHAISVVNMSSIQYLLATVYKAPLNIIYYRYLARFVLKSRGLPTDGVYNIFELGNWKGMLETMIYHCALEFGSSAAYYLIMVWLRSWIYPPSKSKSKEPKKTRRAATPSSSSTTSSHPRRRPQTPAEQT
ncbi:hypothetical protein BZA70DRAFT_266541 [Myxozyma melibiosi]|uniref:Uncharacterized protein n=1 Tax=Myxozyma melibiosi TaxID=54550 RepID=A0ABR1F8Q5_9ASCO